MSSPHVCQPLPQGFQLDRYRIERVLSKGGFSIVYLARDADGAPVAIKEYLPTHLAQRAAGSAAPIVPAKHVSAFNKGMRSFLEEARLLAHIRHPNVVAVLDFAKANGTAYLVMHYEDGGSLAEYVHALAARGEPMRESFLRDIFVRLLSGLLEVHRQKLLHLDLKPANIYLRDDAHPVLLDFGATRRYLGEDDASLGRAFTPGFAAPEQHRAGGELGPWTDIYAIGSTLYYCLAGGKAPQPADLRLGGDEVLPAQRRWARRYSPQLLEIIDWCMTLAIERRPQSVEEVQKVLNGELLDLVDPAWFRT